MAFLIRLLISTALFVAIVVLTFLCAYVIAFVVNKTIQIFANALGIEVTDFFVWLRTKLPKKKEENK